MNLRQFLLVGYLVLLGCGDEHGMDVQVYRGQEEQRDGRVLTRIELRLHSDGRFHMRVTESDGLKTSEGVWSRRADTMALRYVRAGDHAIQEDSTSDASYPMRNGEILMESWVAWLPGKRRWEEEFADTARSKKDYVEDFVPMQVPLTFIVSPIRLRLVR